MMHSGSRTRLLVAPLLATMLVAACGSSGSSSGSNAPPSVSDEEQQYIDALGMAKTFTVAGRRLDLYRADRGYAVSFTR